MHCKYKVAIQSGQKQRLNTMHGNMYVLYIHTYCIERIGFFASFPRNSSANNAAHNVRRGMGSRTWITGQAKEDSCVPSPVLLEPVSPRTTAATPPTTPTPTTTKYGNNDNNRQSKFSHSVTFHNTHV